MTEQTATTDYGYDTRYPGSLAAQRTADLKPGTLVRLRSQEWPGSHFGTAEYVSLADDPRNVLVRLLKPADPGTVTVEWPRHHTMIAEPLPAHLWPCGCLRNDAGAHRVGCPDHPEGVRP